MIYIVESDRLTLSLFEDEDEVEDDELDVVTGGGTGGRAGLEKNCDFGGVIGNSFPGAVIDTRASFATFILS